MPVKRARWLVIADSLALPRPGVPYECTWPFLLQERFAHWDWINLARRESTTDRLNTDGDGSGGDCLEFYEPDGVILHLGICDCAPRLYRRRDPLQYVIFNLPGGLGRRVTNLVERHIGRKVRYAWVGPEKFEANLEKYLGRCRRFGTRVVALEIMPVDGDILKKNPEIVGRIALYNEIYRRVESRHPDFHVVRIFEPGVSMKDHAVDGYHLNREGGLLVAQGLERVLSRITAMPPPGPGGAT